MWPNPQKLRISSHLLKKPSIENFILCVLGDMLHLVQIINIVVNLYPEIVLSR